MTFLGLTVDACIEKLKHTDVEDIKKLSKLCNMHEDFLLHPDKEKEGETCCYRLINGVFNLYKHL